MLLLCMISTSPALGSRSRLLQEQQQDTDNGPALEELRNDTSVGFSGSWPDTLVSGYLSNEQLAEWSANFTRGSCSNISRRFSIGKSVMGVDLWVVEIAANPGQVEAKPNFKYVSAAADLSTLQLQRPPAPAHDLFPPWPLWQALPPTSAASAPPSASCRQVANMHGDEPGGRVLLPMLAEWLCSKQATDLRAARILNGMHLVCWGLGFRVQGFFSNTNQHEAVSTACDVCKCSTGLTSCMISSSRQRCGDVASCSPNQHMQLRR